MGVCGLEPGGGGFVLPDIRAAVRAAGDADVLYGPDLWLWVCAGSAAAPVSRELHQLLCVFRGFVAIRERMVAEETAGVVENRPRLSRRRRADAAGGRALESFGERRIPVGRGS